ncbi:FAD-dependent oxidoreductase [Nostoc sp.]|uniref:FAD-dependent oxidoreductase n=1 Tax=Nostoc sp. TaxID=1180 RepID=UPI002FF59A8F
MATLSPRKYIFTVYHGSDVCVVGAGIAAMSTAYMLTRESESVVVLNDDPIGGGQTAITTAHLSNVLTSRYHELE